MYKILLASLVMILAACAARPTQTVVSIPDATPKNICILDNPKVERELMKLFQDILEKKGYSVRIVLKQSENTDCPIIATYQAFWWWDLKAYLSKAEINVYDKELLIGRAIYNADELSLAKFHDAETTLSEIINKLFP